MTRRDISRLAVLGSGVAGVRDAFAQKAAARTEPVTDYVARFIVNTRYEDIPSDVIELARKSILDGLGLALCGSAARTGELARQYIESLGTWRRGAAGPCHRDWFFDESASALCRLRQCGWHPCRRL